MALTTSGQIDLNAMHVEAGGTSGTECTVNDTDIRGMISKASGAQMGFNEWYGASSETVYQSTGSYYVAYSSDSKFGGPHEIVFRNTAASNAWTGAQSSLDSGTYNDRALTLQDHNSVGDGPRVLWSYNSTGTNRNTYHITGGNADWKTGVYAKLYYSNSLLATWSYLRDAAAFGGFAIQPSSSPSSSNNLINGSRTTASAWRLDIHIPS